MIYISDSDEDMKRAIALSLGQAEEIHDVPEFSAAASGSTEPTAPISGGDEFDQMCASDMSLKERLSKSSLDSEEEDNSVRILKNRIPTEENANLPGPSNIPLTKKTHKVILFYFFQHYDTGTGTCKERLLL